MNKASTKSIDSTISFACSGPRINSPVERASASRAVGADTDTADNSVGEIPVRGSNK